VKTAARSERRRRTADIGRTLTQGRRALGGSAVLLALALGCGEAAAPEAETPTAQRSPGAHEIAVLELRDLGEIRIELLPELAPETVANFKKLASKDFYDGTYFHRVLSGFMIQGGDPHTKDGDPRNDGKGGPGYSIPDEFTDYPHRRGVVSMANRGSRNSGGSQFFIVLADAPHLDGKYAVFGSVVGGMEVAEAIAALELDVYGRYGPSKRPYPVSAVIESVAIESAQPAAAQATPNAAPRS
jgi:cyclophilin family peptidyl-prolyl cis-trans isomerase